MHCTSNFFLVFVGFFSLYFLFAVCNSFPTNSKTVPDQGHSAPFVLLLYSCQRNIEMEDEIKVSYRWSQYLGILNLPSVFLHHYNM